LFPNETSAITLHRNVFTRAIESQGSDEQKATWLKKAKNVEIIGAYAQTELGHGRMLLAVE